MILFWNQYWSIPKKVHHSLRPPRVSPKDEGMSLGGWVARSVAVVPSLGFSGVLCLWANMTFVEWSSPPILLTAQRTISQLLFSAGSCFFHENPRPEMALAYSASRQVPLALWSWRGHAWRRIGPLTPTVWTTSFLVYLGGRRAGGLFGFRSYIPFQV